MKPSLTKLVDVILKRIEEHPEATPSESGLRSWLKRQGYNKHDIDAAMKLVRPHVVGGPRSVECRRVSVRLLSSYEEQRLTPEARNALVRLDLYGLIDPQEREMILERLNQFEGEVGLDELDYLLSWVVCSLRDVESQHAIYSVLEGGNNVVH